MKLSIISDVHIMNNNDEADKLLMSFFSHEIVKNSDRIILLGDIFDMLAGGYKAYYSKYENFFTQLEELLENGREVWYFEGNHDVHLEKLFKKFSDVYTNFQLIKDKKVIEINGKKLYISHGDDIEVDNGMYETYKKFLTSMPINFLFNYFLPYTIVKKIGESASNKSKKTGHRRYNFDKSKEKFRRSAQRLFRLGYDIVVSGHSHVQDKYTYELNGREHHYFNNGYALASKTFLHIDSELNSKFIELD